ncbi:MAG: hypothetical protein ACLSW4_00875 [Clostridia bacterium]|jgi:hypothetical protein|nr:hypothetical protein [Clostridium sp.]HJJ12896.1 hypothetical protein [Clostridiaceae bacterium]
MTDKEREFIKEVNIDKAKKKTIAPMVFIGISLLTYVMPLMWGEFDFGILFEVASLVFLILARNYMSQYDETRAKRYIICSIVSIGWILIYDIILLCVSIQDAIDVAFLGYDYLLGEFFLILYLIILFAINKDLSKADNPEKYKESTDWFYERYESDEKNDIK